MWTSDLELWLCLNLRHLPVEIFTRGDDENKPVVVTDQRRICHMSPAARQNGIRIGSSLDTAYTLSDQVIVFERDEVRELETLNQLAQWVYRFTPGVSVKPPDCLLLDIRPSLKLFGGIDSIRQQIESGLSELGYSAEYGIHTTPLAAFACARANVPDLYSVEQLPLSSLDLEASALVSLNQMGVSRLGELLEMPEEGLARRFGAFFIDRIHRLTGRRADPQKYISERPVFASEITFLSDVDNLESLVFPMRRLLSELCDFLTLRQLKLDTFTFRLAHRAHEPHSFSIHLAEPENDLSLFLQLTQLQLEKVSDVREVDSVRLSARRFTEASSQSGDLFHNTRFRQKDGRTGALADRENSKKLRNIFTTRLGPDACFGLSLANDHRPEKAWQPIRLIASHPDPVQRNNASGRASKMQRAVTAGHRNDINGGIHETEQSTPPRPAYLLSKPRMLDSIDGKPVLGGKLDLLQGPERIDFGWWEEDVNRDYYVARHGSGSLYWIFHDRRSKKWFLHGLFG